MMPGLAVITQLFILCSYGRSMITSGSGTIRYYRRVSVPRTPQHRISAMSVMGSYCSTSPHAIHGQAIGVLRGGAVSDDKISFEGDVSISSYPSSPSVVEDDSSIEIQQLQEQNTETNHVIGGPPPGLLRRSLPSVPWHRLPDWLTYARCAAIPILGIVFYYPISNPRVSAGLTAAIFAFASFTDYLDGYLARRWEVTSSFGAFLDPVADKLMVSTALILLSGRYGKYVAIPSAIILAREIAVSALREWMAQRNLRDSVKVGFQGKIKTAATMVALTVLLMVPAEVGAAKLHPISSFLHISGIVLLYLSTLITITSGLVYFRAAAPNLLSNKYN